MKKTHTDQAVRGRSPRLCVAIVLVCASSAPDGLAAPPTPLHASRRCREVIGRVSGNLATVGLRNISRCHEAEARGRAPRADCNVLDGGASSAYGRAQALLNKLVGNPSICAPDDPAFATVPGGNSQGLRSALLPAVKGTLEESGETLQGSSASLVSDLRSRSVARCRRAIGAARDTIVRRLSREALRCQRRIDRKATTFAGLDRSCLRAAGRQGERAAAKVARACKGVSGATAGTCEDLPDCVVRSAEATGHALARLTYSDVRTFACGNGILELGEECDDGNTVPDDGCEADCRPSGAGRCGDGDVDPPEECDDENNRTDDDCIECRASMCGDGFVDIALPDVEECDDGNDVAGDGCTGCRIDGKLCSESGIIANVRFEYSERVTGRVLGFTVELVYPAPLSIPGSLGVASVRQRVTSQLPPEFRLIASDLDPDADGTDDRLRMLASSATESIPSGAIARVQFDCPQGAEVRPSEVPCVIQDVSDAAGQVIPPERLAKEGVRCFVDSLDNSAATGSGQPVSLP